MDQAQQASLGASRRKSEVLHASGVAKKQSHKDTILSAFMYTKANKGQSSLLVAPSDSPMHQSGASSVSTGESSQNVWHRKMRTTSCICVICVFEDSR